MNDQYIRSTFLTFDPFSWNLTVLSKTIKFIIKIYNFDEVMQHSFEKKANFTDKEDLNAILELMRFYVKNSINFEQTFLLQDYIWSATNKRRIN